MTPVNCADHVLSLGHYENPSKQHVALGWNPSSIIVTSVLQLKLKSTVETTDRQIILRCSQLKLRSFNQKSGHSVENSSDKNETLDLELKLQSSCWNLSITVPAPIPQLKPNPTTETSVSQWKLQSHGWTFSPIVETPVPQMTLQDPELKLLTPGYNSSPAVKT